MPLRGRSRSRTPGYGVGFPMSVGGVLASLDFDFQNGRYYQSGQGVDPLALTTTSRASVGYAESLAGVWSPFLSNVPRITNKGLLVEELRTNSLRNNSMQDAVAGSPGTLPTNWTTLTSTGGLTQTIVGVGTTDGIDYIDIRWAGTSSNSTPTARGFEANTQIAAAVGQTWSSSVFATLIGGSIVNTGGIVLRIRERDAGGASLDTGSGPALTLTAGALGNNRHMLIRTLAQATTAFAVPEIAFAPSGVGLAIDLTLRIGWPQLELGSFATSPIRTTGAAATRAADVVTVTTLPAFGAAYSIFGKGSPNAPLAYTSTQSLFSIDDGSTNNRLLVFRAVSSGLPNVIYTVGGNAFGTSFGVAIQPSTSAKLAASFTTGSLLKAANGVPDSNTAGGLLPFTPTQSHIGVRADGASAWWDGYIERVTTWGNNAFSLVDLQRITA